MLHDLREQMNGIDSALLTLLQARLDLARQIGTHKAQSGSPIYDPHREMAILHRLQALASDEDPMAIEAVWSTLFRESRRLQYHDPAIQSALGGSFYEQFKTAPTELTPPKRILYLGQSNSGQATFLAEHFPQSVLTPCLSLSAAFRQLREETVDHLFLPLEDETIGSHHEIYRYLAEEEAYILASYKLHSPYALFAPIGTKLNDVKSVFSSAKALEAYRPMLSTMGWRSVEERSVEEAVIKIAELQPLYTAVLATRYEAQANGLAQLPCAFPDLAQRRSRFVLVGRRLHRLKGLSQICFTFDIPKQPRYMAYVMGLMADFNLDLTKIRTYDKVGSPWVQTLVLELGLREDQVDSVREAMFILRLETQHFRLLGSYPEWEVQGQ